MARNTDQEIARQGRIVAVVIAGAMLLWIGAQVLGAKLGLPPRFAFLFDLLALAAFLWALVNIFWIWRKRRDSEGQ